jgi:hypothetical protein
VTRGLVARFLGKVVWIALALIVLYFSLAGAGFLVMTSGRLVDLLTGHGPDDPGRLAHSMILAVFAFLMSVTAFATISLPGLWFVGYTVRAFWRHETDWTNRYD